MFCALQKVESAWEPGEYVGLVYSDRMRTQADKDKVIQLYYSMAPATSTQIHTISDNTSESSVTSLAMDDITPEEAQIEHQHTHRFQGEFNVTSGMVQVGHSFLQQKDTGQQEGVKSLQMLHHCRPALESLIKCIQMNWMAILVSILKHPNNILTVKMG